MHHKTQLENKRLVATNDMFIIQMGWNVIQRCSVVNKEQRGQTRGGKGGSRGRGGRGGVTGSTVPENEWPGEVWEMIKYSGFDNTLTEKIHT